jgi:phospholipase D1/2
MRTVPLPSDAPSQAARRPHRRRGPAWGKIIAFAIAIAALAALWRFTPLSEYLTQDRIAGWARVARETPWAPIAVMIAYTPAAFLMFPRPLVTLFTVIAFGPWLGFTYSMTGILLAALATYYVGRAMSPETVKRIAGDRMEHVTCVLRRHGLIAVFVIRIVAVAPFSVEGIIAGAARIKLWHYTLGTFAGMFPGVLATTVFGKEIAAALDDTSRINYWIVAGAVLFFVVTTYLVRRWLVQQQRSSG